MARSGSVSGKLERIQARLRPIWKNHKRRWGFGLLSFLLLVVLFWGVTSVKWGGGDERTIEESPSPAVQEGEVQASQLPGGLGKADGTQLSLRSGDTWIIPPIWMRLTSRDEAALKGFLVSYRSAFANRSLQGASAEDLDRLWPTPVKSAGEWKVEVSYDEGSIPLNEVSVHSGDTLDRFARREETDLPTLYSLNERKKLDNLQDGAKLRLPDAHGVSLRLFYAPSVAAEGWEGALKPLGELAWQQTQSFYNDILKVPIPDMSKPIQVPYGVPSAPVEYHAREDETVAEVARRFHLTPFHLLWLNRDRMVITAENSNA